MMIRVVHTSLFWTNFPWTSGMIRQSCWTLDGQQVYALLGGRYCYLCANKTKAWIFRFWESIYKKNESRHFVFICGKEKNKYGFSCCWWESIGRIMMEKRTNCPRTCTDSAIRSKNHHDDSSRTYVPLLDKLSLDFWHDPTKLLDVGRQQVYASLGVRYCYLCANKTTAWIFCFSESISNIMNHDILSFLWQGKKKQVWFFLLLVREHFWQNHDGKEDKCPRTCTDSAIRSTNHHSSRTYVPLFGHTFLGLLGMIRRRLLDGNRCMVFAHMLCWQVNGMLATVGSFR